MHETERNAATFRRVNITVNKSCNPPAVSLELALHRVPHLPFNRLPISLFACDTTFCAEIFLTCFLIVRSSFCLVADRVSVRCIFLLCFLIFLLNLYCSALIHFQKSFATNNNDATCACACYKAHVWLINICCGNDKSSPYCEQNCLTHRLATVDTRPA